MADINSELERHRTGLLGLPGCTAIAVGKKIVAGKATDADCIVVFVRKKGEHAPGDAVPRTLGGIPTDVVEKDFNFRPTATNPLDRFDPLIGGISVTAWEDPMVYGTIGCFIDTDGHVAPTPAGIFLLTNMHVLQACAAPGADPRTIQPVATSSPPPANHMLGSYIHGQRDATHDCAVATIGHRGYRNQVPNHPLHPGNRALAGIAAAAVHDRVYKYGATTKHTVGTVTNTNFHSGLIQHAIYIQGENHGLWCAGGDSGSVLIRYSDDHVLGLNFSEDTLVPVDGGSGAGLAYDITTQLQVFGNHVTLAP